MSSEDWERPEPLPPSSNGEPTISWGMFSACSQLLLSLPVSILWLCGYVPAFMIYVIIEGVVDARSFVKGVRTKVREN